MTRVLILGSGVSGRAAARLATRLGMSVTVFDEASSHDPIGLGVGMASGSWDREILNGIDLVVTSPGFSERSQPIVETLETGLPIWSEVEFASRHVRAPLVAITGTNGKTSVTEATAMMLDASGLEAPATGNIGAPLSDFTEEDYHCLVVEVSSFQLRFTEQFHPVAAAITNVAVDHLDWHGSAYAYADAKARIFANQTETDVLVYGRDDPGASKMVAGASSRLIPVSVESLPAKGSGVDGQDALMVGNVRIDVADLASNDPAHVFNVACAGTLALEMGATSEGVISGAGAYQPGAHRREVIAESRGVTWVNDSKATNLHAARASVRAHESVILIAGGRTKGLDVTDLALEPGVKLLLGIGEGGPDLVNAAEDRGRLAGTLEAAVAIAHDQAVDGDTVLLAPGSASFDQFESYSARGDAFRSLVTDLVGTA